MMVDSPASSSQQQRHQAVRMRLAGTPLAEVAVSTGLSAPTVINAVRAFRRGGWAAIEVRAPGRPAGHCALSRDEEQGLVSQVLHEQPSSGELWDAARVASLAHTRYGKRVHGRALSRLLGRAGLALPTMAEQAARDAVLADWHRDYLTPLLRSTRRQAGEFIWCGEWYCDWYGERMPGESTPARLLVAQTLRGTLAWMPSARPFAIETWLDFLARIAGHWPAIRGVLWHGIDVTHPALLAQAQALGLRLHAAPRSPGAWPRRSRAGEQTKNSSPSQRPPVKPTHLQRLEAESVHIMREVIAEAERPVLLYTAGKDSATMLHIARKAFFPAPPPFPLLHVDTTWEFRDMYAMREQVARDYGMQLIVHRNPEALRRGINPFTHGSQIHADLWNTEGLRQALDTHRFDIAFGGARRDEEKSRAKERVFSFRTAQHRWDPKNQRPELWNLYNARKKPDESIRVFPLSNWTELDIWQYILLENVPIVPLYLARERPVVERNGALIMVDDERMPLQPGEVPVMRKVRFRTLGCYPLTAAVESEAESLPEVIEEIFRARTSERHGRLIDHDGPASMERKKQEGYF